MNINQSQSPRLLQPSQRDQGLPRQQRSDPEGASQAMPEDGGDTSRNRGDSNRTPRGQPQPLGRPPQQQGEAHGSDPRQQSLDSASEDTDDAGDTQPNLDIHAGDGATSAGRT